MTWTRTPCSLSNYLLCRLVDWWLGFRTKQAKHVELKALSETSAAETFRNRLAWLQAAHDGVVLRVESMLCSQLSVIPGCHNFVCFFSRCWPHYGLALQPGHFKSDICFQKVPYSCPDGAIFISARSTTSSGSQNAIACCQMAVERHAF